MGTLLFFLFLCLVFGTGFLLAGLQLLFMLAFFGGMFFFGLMLVAFFAGLSVLPLLVLAGLLGAAFWMGRRSRPTLMGARRIER